MSTSDFEILQPRNWKAPKGYANGIAAEGKQVFVAGQVGWNERSEFDSDDFVAQVEQALSNIVRVVAEAGGEPRHLTRLTWYVTNKTEYVTRQREVGDAYRRVRQVRPPEGQLPERADRAVEPAAIHRLRHPLGPVERAEQ